MLAATTQAVCDDITEYLSRVTLSSTPLPECCYLERTLKDTTVEGPPRAGRGAKNGREPATPTPHRSDTPEQRTPEEDRTGQTSPQASPERPTGQAGQLPQSRGEGRLGALLRTPLYAAENADRYQRQDLIKAYEELTGATLIVVIDAIFHPNMTYLEELLCDVDATKPMHLLLASPGGDGETAIRMVRSIQARCSELTVVIPDMAKSAATLLCLGADRILMGPAGDLGPVDPQFPVGRGLVGAKEIVAAVDEAEERISGRPESYALFASLLADVNMIMVRQARSALDRSGALVREALSCAHGRSLSEVEKLTETLQAPLIDEPASHGTVVSAAQAADLGLPVESVDVQSDQWHLIWAL